LIEDEFRHSLAQHFWRPPGHRPGHALSRGIRRVTEPRAQIAGLGPCGSRSLPHALPNSRSAVSSPLQHFRPGHPQWRPIFTVGPPAISYNVCMLIDEDQSPAIAEHEPREPDDQFDEDLMWHLTKHPHKSGGTNRQHGILTRDTDLRRKASRRARPSHQAASRVQRFLTSEVLGADSNSRPIVGERAKH
jgi:hypothetical protein